MGVTPATDHILRGNAADAARGTSETLFQTRSSCPSTPESPFNPYASGDPLMTMGWDPNSAAHTSVVLEAHHPLVHERFTLLTDEIENGPLGDVLGWTLGANVAVIAACAEFAVRPRRRRLTADMSATYLPGLSVALADMPVGWAMRLFYFGDTGCCSSRFDHAARGLVEVLTRAATLDENAVAVMTLFLADPDLDLLRTSVSELTDVCLDVSAFTCVVDRS